MAQSATLGAPFWRFWTAVAAANLADGVRAGAFPLLAVALGGTPFEIAAEFPAGTDTTAPLPAHWTGVSGSCRATRSRSASRNPTPPAAASPRIPSR